jgi:holo-[acyl-carrier protein] synthase
MIRTGIDIVQVSRIKKSVDELGERFLSRIFTPLEREYSEGKKRKFEHLAARFAAKEAFIKACGGRYNVLNFNDIEVYNEVSGRPRLRINPKVAEQLCLTENTQMDVTLAHDETFAVAQVSIEGWEPPNDIFHSSPPLRGGDKGEGEK